MEKYLGNKGQSRRGKDVPLLVFLGFMLVMVFVAIDPKEYLTDGVGALAFAIILGIFAVPFCLILRNRRMWKDARAVARCLAVREEPTMPLEELGTLAKLKHPGKRVTQLLDKGYLGNVQPDPANSAVQLLAWTPSRRATPKPRKLAPVDLRCPHCGGVTSAIPGQPARCQWCDSALENPEK